MKSEEFSELQKEWKTALEYEANDASVKRYHPKKLNLQPSTY